LSLDALIVL